MIEYHFFPRETQQIYQAYKIYDDQRDTNSVLKFTALHSHEAHDLGTTYDWG